MYAHKRHPCRLAYCNLIPESTHPLKTKSAGVLTPSRSCMRLRLGAVSADRIGLPRRGGCFFRGLRFCPIMPLFIYSSFPLFLHRCAVSPLHRSTVASLHPLTAPVCVSGWAPFPLTGSACSRQGRGFFAACDDVHASLLFSSTLLFFYSCSTAPSRPCTEATVASLHPLPLL